MTEYRCGHKTSGLMILDSSPTAMSTYLRWSETVGVKGTKEQCFDCWKKERNK